MIKFEECQQENARLQIENRELRQAKMRANTLLYGNPCPVLIWNTSLTVTDVNEAFLNATGYSRGEALAITVNDFRYCHAKGGDFKEAVQNGRPSIGEMNCVFPSGEMVWVCQAIPVLSDQDTVEYTITIFTDITRTRDNEVEAERLKTRLSKMIAQNPLAISVLAADKSRIDMNDQYLKMWRGTRSELNALDPSDFKIKVTGGDDFYRSFETKEKAQTEMEVSWEDGSTSHLILYQTPVLNAVGEIDLNYYLYQDLTSSKEIARYRAAEVQKVSMNLEHLAVGDLDFSTAVAGSNQYTREAREEFLAIEFVKK